MSETMSTADIATRRVVYSVPGMQHVRVRRDIVYAIRDDRPLTIDVYLPNDGRESQLRPAVLLVTGYADPGFERMLGCPAKEMGAFVSWAQLLAASGMVAITYVNQVAADARAVFNHVRQHASELGIDAARVGLWACSGHGPNALALLMRHPEHVRCVCLISAYTLDRPGSAHVAKAAELFRFATAERGTADLPGNVPLFAARAGADAMPGLNDALDAFVGAALERNLPVMVVNHATGPHAFDVFDDSETSREIIRAAVQFLRFHLGAGDAAAPQI